MSKYDKMLEAADKLQSGCLIFIRGYRSSNGELANYWLNYGRDYNRIRDNLVESLKKILFNGEPFCLHVDYITWVDDKGEHPLEAKGRIKVPVSLDLSVADPDVKQALQELLRSYDVPKAKKMPFRIYRYRKQAKGVYVKQATNSIYFRMSTLVQKQVVEPAIIEEYSTRKIAIKRAIRDKFMKLRAFRLGQFEVMSINGEHFSGKQPI